MGKRQRTIPRTGECPKCGRSSFIRESQDENGRFVYRHCRYGCGNWRLLEPDSWHHLPDDMSEYARMGRKYWCPECKNPALLITSRGIRGRKYFVIECQEHGRYSRFDADPFQPVGTMPHSHSPRVKYTSPRSGDKHPSGRTLLPPLSDADIARIRSEVASGRTQESVALEYCISQSHVSKIIHGKRRTAPLKEPRARITRERSQNLGPRVRKPSVPREPKAPRAPRERKAAVVRDQTSLDAEAYVVPKDTAQAAPSSRKRVEDRLEELRLARENREAWE